MNKVCKQRWSREEAKHAQRNGDGKAYLPTVQEREQSVLTKGRVFGKKREKGKKRRKRKLELRQKRMRAREIREREYCNRRIGVSSVKLYYVCIPREILESREF